MAYKKPDWLVKLEQQCTELSKRTGIPYDSCYNLLNGDSEQDQIREIRAHLLTDENKKLLRDLDLSLEQVMNGDFRILDQPGISAMFAEWNKRLDMKLFG